MGLADRLKASMAGAVVPEGEKAATKETGAQRVLETGFRSRVETAEANAEQFKQRCEELEASSTRDQALIAQLQARGDAGGAQALDPSKVVRSRYYNRTPQSFDPERSPEFAAFVDSIRSTGGNVDPGMVRPKDDGTFELVFGERRATACRIAGVPFNAIIASIDDKQLLHYRIIENRDREDVSSWSMARQALAAIDIHGNDAAGREFLESSGYARAQVFRLLKIASLPITLEHLHPMIDTVSYRVLMSMADRLAADPKGFAVALRALEAPGLTSEQATNLLLGRDGTKAKPTPNRIQIKRNSLQLKLTVDRERAEAIAERISVLLREFNIEV